MKPEERKIAKRDMEFLANYADTYYPIHDSMPDFREAIRATEGFDKAQAILIKDKERLENKLRKAREKLTAMSVKYGKRVYEIVSQCDNHSN